MFAATMAALYPDQARPTLRYPRLDDIETRLAGGEKTLDFPFAISALLSSAAQRDISSRPGLPKRG
jgi:hypothetical protein